MDYLAYSMFYFSRTAWTNSLRIMNELHKFIKKDTTQNQTKA